MDASGSRTSPPAAQRSSSPCRCTTPPAITTSKQQRVERTYGAPTRRSQRRAPSRGAEPRGRAVGRAQTVGCSLPPPPHRIPPDVGADTVEVLRRADDVI